MRLFGTVALATLATTLLWAEPDAGPVSNPGNEIIGRYLSAIQAQQTHAQSVSMEVDIDAKLPRLQKRGRLHVLKFITKLGQIFYGTPKFEGDSTVKKEVIARYLKAETEAKGEYAAQLAVTPENYKFKYKGLTDYAGRAAYVFQLSPRAKRVGLFKGEIWIDKETSLPLREWGELVKNPSVFLKSVYFVRDFAIYGGMTVPRRLISDVNTRLVGKAQLTIWFDNYKVGDQVRTTAMLGNGGGSPAASDGFEH